jgi:hypothetical protein
MTPSRIVWKGKLETNKQREEGKTHAQRDVAEQKQAAQAVVLRK